MKQTFIIILNLLIFFFIAGVFSSIISIGEKDAISDKIMLGIIFGIIMMVIPNILKFFKLPVNTGSSLLLGFLLSFVFYFFSLYLFGFITVVGSRVDLGIPLIPLVILQDKTIVMVFLSIFSALISVGIEYLSRRR